jgi:hypothetical protein
MTTKSLAALALACLISTCLGCKKSKDTAGGSPGPKITQEMVSGSWVGGADGDVKKREAFFGKDGKGTLSVNIASAAFQGTIRYEFTYRLDTESGSVRLVNALDDKKEGKPGKAELTPDGKMHFVLDSQDCVLTRSVAKP